MIDEVQPYPLGVPKRVREQRAAQCTKFAEAAKQRQQVSAFERGNHVLPDGTFAPMPMPMSDPDWHRYLMPAAADAVLRVKADNVSWELLKRIEQLEHRVAMIESVLREHERVLRGMRQPMAGNQRHDILVRHHEARMREAVAKAYADRLPSFG